MQQQTNNNTYTLINNPNSLTTADKLNKKILATLKMAIFLFALSALPIQSYADKAYDYGDINDEDGQYVSLHTDLKKKVSYQSKSLTTKQKVKIKTKTKQVTETDLKDKPTTGYGDLDQGDD